MSIPSATCPRLQWADLRQVGAGEACINCGAALEMWKGIEVGHIFKLGTKFSESFDARVQDEEGASRPIVMGSYGIGVERNMAAVVETSHDERGIVWPVAIAPYEAIITVLRPDEPTAAEAAEKLYAALGDAGVEVLFDDRQERPGVKFADAELIGIPWRITVGPRGVAQGMVELTERSTMETTEVSIDQVASQVAELVAAAR